jgi:putative DNA primase/helicase
MYSDQLRYVPEWRAWLHWDGKRWARDIDSAVVTRLAQDYANSLWQIDFSQLASDEVNAIHRFIKLTNSANGIRAFVELARVLSDIVVKPNQLDSNPLLVNLRNGTLNLGIGQISPHSQSDLITQMADMDYDPSHTCPEWLACVNTIFSGDSELIGYVQSLLGYSLAGLNNEHILPIAYGSGCNGKSTLWNTVSALLGDYALLADDSLLLGDHDTHPAAKVALFGKRFVTVSEPELGCKLRESRVKSLTGDSIITARGMRENFWSFNRTHKFWLATNHLPRIDGTDDGIWRRVKLIPFSVNLAELGEPDTGLQDRLLSKERSGILNWLIEGWRRYKQDGFVEPKCVREVTAKYRADSDPLTGFINECCEVGNNFAEPINCLYDAYLAKCGTLGEREFNKAIKSRFAHKRLKSGPHRDKLVCEGIRVRA